MNYTIDATGNKKPSIAIVGCVHGDEIIGKKIIRELKKLKLEKGSLSFVVANKNATDKRKRYIKEDLNRSFPGVKGGQAERGLAYKLRKELREYDIVIDLHATKSDFDRLAIITKLDKDVKRILKITPIQKVALIRPRVFGGKELIAHVKLGISLEYGFGKDGKNYMKGLRDVKIILKNLGIINGSKKSFFAKELYIVSGAYSVPAGFKQNSSLKDFKKIKKEQEIGQINNNIIYSRHDFYPIFLGKGRYKKTLSLMASKKEIKI